MSTHELQVFEDLTDDETQAIFTMFPVLEVSPGSAVVTQGSDDRAVYVVMRGAFDVCVNGPSGELTIATMGVGTVFGELSFLDDLPRSATVRATEQSEVLRMDREGFDVLAASNASAAFKIYRDLARVVTRRLRLANEKIVAGS